MTATRIRETADGVLYRLSKRHVFKDALGVEGRRRWTLYVLAVDERCPKGHYICCRFHVYPANRHGEMTGFDVLLGSNDITDPDAMIEAMGYTALQEES